MKFQAITSVLMALSSAVLANPVPVEGLEVEQVYNTTALEARQQYSFTYQAFDGDACNGAAGQAFRVNFPGPPACYDTTGARHSFRLAGQCGTIVYKIYSSSGCNGPYTYGASGNGCFHVNNGKPWLSTQVQCAADGS